MEIDTIIEIPGNTNLKFEYDYSHKKMRLDRKLETSMVYPGNYGYVPNTLCGDGDALDIIMPVDYQIPLDTVVRCRVIGVFLMEDEAGMDEKLIVYPAPSVDNRFNHIKKIGDVPKTTLNKIEHFFQRYKDLSKGKFVKTRGFKSQQYAVKILNNSQVLYKKSKSKTSKSKTSKSKTSKSKKKKSIKKK